MQVERNAFCSEVDLKPSHFQISERVWDHEPWRQGVCTVISVELWSR